MEPREPQYKKFYVEWWKIRRSTISAIVGFLVISAIIGVFAWLAMRNNWFSQENVISQPKTAASILTYEGDVRIIRAATRETVVVTKETFIAAGDTIQTQSDGKAIVQMIDGSVLTVRPNSTMIIKDNSSIFGGPNVRVSLDDGQLNVRTDQLPADGKNVVEMSESETTIKSQTDASFNADAQTNGGEIRITRGSVDTTVGGAKTTLNENQFASVNDGRITSKEQLLLAPKPVQPSDGAQLVDSGAGVGVTFVWEEGSTIPISGYYIQVSRSPTFASDAILADRSSLTSREFRLAGLQPGTYYWRVRSTARSGQNSEWNPQAKFTVVRRGSSPAIDVSAWGVDPVGGSVYIISGRTQPGLLVKSQGNQVFAANDGSFRLQVSSSAGEVPVELTDDRGNRAGFVLSLRNSRVVRRF
ncbi:MAG TPA: FecR domain-containing protein [Pyrinomonadaceae bacterium]|nr:FecR domain-containing protein [Pyrinomonadaceae bacterium]